MNYAARNQQIIENLATQNNMSAQHVSSILQTYNRVSVLDTSVDAQMTHIAQEVGVDEQHVKQVISQASRLLRTRTDIMDAVARQESVDTQTVDQAVQGQLQAAVGATDTKSNDIVKSVSSPLSLQTKMPYKWLLNRHTLLKSKLRMVKGLGTNEQMSVSVKDAVTETAEQTGLQPEQVRMVATQAAYVVKSNQTIVAQLLKSKNLNRQLFKKLLNKKSKP